MIYRIVIHDRALREIRAAYLRIASDSAGIALNWYEELFQAIRSLNINPERCEVAPESSDLPITLRHLLHGSRQSKYRIIFSVRLDRVHVWTVRHSARDWLGFNDLLS
jgi:plasmid stabilization system protein ParE